MEALPSNTFRSIKNQLFNIPYDVVQAWAEAPASDNRSFDLRGLKKRRCARARAHIRPRHSLLPHVAHDVADDYGTEGGDVEVDRIQAQ